jgi:hypothetical protein
MTSRSREVARALVAVAGFVAFVVIISVTTVSAIDRGLLASGVSPASKDWATTRGVALQWTFGFGVFGFIGHAAVVYRAWLLQPRFDTGRLAILQIVVTGAALVAMSVFDILGLLIGAPVASLICYIVLRLWH